jgi:hypothetical protein
MDAWKLVIRYKGKKPKLLAPISDEQQLLINERIDSSLNSRVNLNPTDLRALPYIRSALWLWKE